MNQSFYHSGLRFQCRRCSKCCRHTPGYVFLSEYDIKYLISTLKLSRAEFLDAYCRKVNIGGFFRLSLKEKINYDCIFWEDGGCIVYRQRPLQCRSFPFWNAHMASPESWIDLSCQCPGIGQGRVHKKENIEYWLNRRLDEKLIVFKS